MLQHLCSAHSTEYDPVTGCLVGSDSHANTAGDGSIAVSLASGARGLKLADLVVSNLNMGGTDYTYIGFTEASEAEDGTIFSFR